MQLLFEFDFSDSPIEEVMRRSEIYSDSPELIQEFARSLVLGTLSHMETIDAMIVDQNRSWQIHRLHGVDRNILRIAIYELIKESDVPAAVILDEAVEIAKKFGSEESPKFINGVLDGIRKKHFSGKAVHS